jgi:hypothetical protein
MKQHWDYSCTKATTKDGSACIIQKAYYRNYRRRPASYSKRVWEVVRSDNTPKEKKFLGMPYPEKKMTIYLVYQVLHLRVNPSVQTYPFTEDSFDN